MGDPFDWLGSRRRDETFAWLDGREDAVDLVLDRLTHGSVPEGAHPRDYLEDLTDALGRAARARPETFVARLEADASRLERFPIVAALGRLEAPHGEALLRGRLRARSGSIRWLALEALVRRGDATLGPELARLLRDRDSLVGFAAARALRRFGGPDDLAALEAFLPKAAIGAREAALDAIEAICARASLPLPAVHPGERLVRIVADLPEDLGGPAYGVAVVETAERVREGQRIAELRDEDGLVGELVAPCEAVVSDVELGPPAVIVLRRVPAR
ncbi:MAG: HEAT repeat domain-containing protein [Myxococcales bacterium]|nr:HEAT repeat domain-containing protein [Myxococcales bacterium]